MKFCVTTVKSFHCLFCQSVFVGSYWLFCTLIIELANFLTWNITVAMLREKPVVEVSYYLDSIVRYVLNIDFDLFSFIRLNVWTSIYVLFIQTSFEVTRLEQESYVSSTKKRRGCLPMRLQLVQLVKTDEVIPTSNTHCAIDFEKIFATTIPLYLYPRTLRDQSVRL